jgi:hypothetical protein
VGAASLARASLVVLVIATVLAVFYAQELKHQDPLLQEPRGGTIGFQPTGPLTNAHITRFAHFDVRATVQDTLRVSIISERTHATAFVIVVSVPKYQHRAVSWDGRTAAGTLAPTGLYLLRVLFEHHGQTVQPALLLHLEAPPA